MKSFYLTDTGRVREHNEDSVTILKNISGEYLCVVADGMGGHRKGEVASALTVAHLGKRFTESASIGTKIDAVNWLSDNINEINKEILKKAGQYETIDADEAVKKIIGNKGVQIAGVSVDEKLDVSVDKIKVCLYSDPLGMQQKYFAPYYVMSGKDGNNEKITIVVPAIENKNVIYK